MIIKFNCPSMGAIFKRISYRIKWKFTKILQKDIFRFITNTPYLSGDSIALLCDYRVPNQIKKFEVVQKKIANSYSIFVNGHNLEHVLKIAGNQLSNKIVISGNSDQNFNEKLIFNNPSIQFYCQNSAIKDLKNLKTLPIGIENIRIWRSGFKHFHKGLKYFKYENRVLIPPMSPTNSVRSEVVSLAKSKPEIYDVITGLLSPKQYFAIARQYRFIFACEGNGFDTHRLWEILYQNSFPVVLRTRWSETLDWLKLPILYLDKVEDLNTDLLEKFLLDHGDFDSMKTPQLWTPFWDKIISTKTKSGNLLNYKKF